MLGTAQFNAPEPIGKQKVGTVPILGQFLPMQQSLPPLGTYSKRLGMSIRHAFCWNSISYIFQSNLFGWQTNCIKK